MRKYLLSCILLLPLLSFMPHSLYAQTDELPSRLADSDWQIGFSVAWDYLVTDNIQDLTLKAKSYDAAIQRILYFESRINVIVHAMRSITDFYASGLELQYAFLADDWRMRAGVLWKNHFNILKITNNWHFIGEANLGYLYNIYRPYHNDAGFSRFIAHCFIVSAVLGVEYRVNSLFSIGLSDRLSYYVGSAKYDDGYHPNDRYTLHGLINTLSLDFHFSI